MLNRFRGPRDETGVVAVVVALVVCFMIIPMAALAVDIGVQRVARTDAQSVADIVALDIARHIDGRTVAQLESADPSMQELADASADRGAVAGDNFDVTLQFGTVNDANFDPNDPESTNYFAPMTSGVPNSVKVTVHARVGFTFISGTGGANRSAIGVGSIVPTAPPGNPPPGNPPPGNPPQYASDHRGCVTMDSYAAAIESGDSAVLGPLNDILGVTLNAGALTSSGLTTTNVKIDSFLTELKTQLNVGGFDEVLTSTVTADQVVAAEIAALTKSGDAVDATAAQALQAHIRSRINAGAQILVSDLLGTTRAGVTQGGGTSALAADVNAFDLAASAIQIANGSSPVTLSASTPNVVGLNVQATIGSKPTTVCFGDARMDMAQTSVLATAKLDKTGTLAGTVTSLTNGVTSSLGNLSCGLIGALVNVTCYTLPQVTDISVTSNVYLAKASGTVTDVVCDGTRTYLKVLAQSSLAPAQVTLTVTMTLEKRVYPGLLQGPPVVTPLTSTITTVVSTETPANQSTTLELDIPDDYDNPKAGPSGDLSVTNLTVGSSVSGNVEMLNRLPNLTTTVDTLLIDPIKNNTLKPLITELNTQLKSLVGATIAGSTYMPLPTPDCGAPRLVG